jgi:hypothetical protein
VLAGDEFIGFVQLFVSAARHSPQLGPLLCGLSQSHRLGWPDRLHFGQDDGVVADDDPVDWSFSLVLENVWVELGVRDRRELPPDVLLEQITDIVCPTTGTTRSPRMPETIGFASSGFV